jgi:hypothetical protein
MSPIYRFCFLRILIVSSCLIAQKFLQVACEVVVHLDAYFRSRMKQVNVGDYIPRYVKEAIRGRFQVFLSLRRFNFPFLPLMGC